jgi:hypothetical protein
MRRATTMILILFLWTPLFVAACSPAPEHHHHHPVDDDESPMDDDTSPSDDDTSPADDDASPSDDDASPADDDASPSDDDLSPADDDASPTDDDASPADDDDDASPTDDDASPSDDDTAPADDDTAPADDDTAPSDDDTLPGNGGDDDDDDDTTPGNGGDDDDDDDTTPGNSGDDDDDDTTPGNGGDDDDDSAPTDDDASPADDDDNDDMTVDVQYVAGGTYSGAALTLDAAGNATVISGKSRDLLAYTESGGNFSEQLAAFGVYANPSATLGPDGAQHVAFYDWINKNLRYATNAGGEWTDVLVDGTGDVGHYSGIALDAGGAVHIAYTVQTAGVPSGVRHATNASGAWQTDEIADGSQIGDYPQIAIDANGLRYVTYNDDGNVQVCLANWNGAAWSNFALPYSTPDGRASAVAVGSDGTLNVLYHQVSGGMVYATGTYSSLDYNLINSVDNVADTLAMALDGNGVAHITYAIGTNEVGYGNNSGGTWSLQTIGAGYPVFIAANSVNDVAISLARIGVARKQGATWTETYFDYGFTAAAPAMRNDAQARQHFVYLENETATLRHATDATGGWTFESIATPIGTGMLDSGLVVDASGGLHVSFYNGANQNLNYATNAGGTWATSVIDGGPTVGQASAMARDAAGVLHVSYSDDGNGALKYATNAGGAWQTTMVDSSGAIGASAIAVDGAGTAYIAYSNQTVGAIELATGGIGGFSVQTVDAAGGASVSLVLDANGQPQLAYVGAGLRHAALVGSTWQVDTVDPAGTAAGTAIATWGNLGLAIAYQNGAALSLALGRPGNWWLLPVDTLDNVGQQPSLVAAPDGSRYDVGYLGQGGVWLATVTFTAN